MTIYKLLMKWGSKKKLMNGQSSWIKMEKANIINLNIKEDYRSEIINNNGRNGSCLTWLATSLEEKRRWLISNASPRGQCSK